MVPTAWIYSIQFKFCSPQLHQHLHPHSTCHLNNKTSTDSRFALTPISTLVHPVTVTGFTHPLQINVYITLYMLPFIPLHFLCTHFWQLVHCIELLATPLPHTPHGHLTAFCVTFCHSPLIITLVLFILTLMPLFSTKFFHSLSLLAANFITVLLAGSHCHQDFPTDCLYGTRWCVTKLLWTHLFKINIRTFFGLSWVVYVVFCFSFLSHYSFVFLVQSSSWSWLLSHSEYILILYSIVFTLNTTYHTPFCHLPSQSYQVSKIICFSAHRVF